MKKNMKKKIFNFAFCLALVGIFTFGMSNVHAATTLRSYSFSGSAAPITGKYVAMDYLEGMEAGYVKVNIKANNGDNYDLKLVYTSTFPSERKTLATKKGISAKGSNNTFYFIPQNGSCPGSSSQCIRVPVVNKISDANHAISYYDVMYGIEVVNGSWLGGTLNVSGTYSMVDY